MMEMNLSNEKSIEKLRNASWLLRLTAWSLAILFVIYVFWVSFDESHEIFIRNNSQEKIEIKDISLNKKSIQSSITLNPNRSDFIQVREILKYPNTNFLEISLVHNTKETQLNCTFFIKKNNCQEEVVIESGKIWCEDFCSNVFD